MSGTAVVGLLHPGEMGTAIAAELSRVGHRVLWASEGRGGQTRARAEAAGLEDVGTVERLAGLSEVILSICPPSAVLEVARSVVGFSGIYVDANAVSPSTAGEVGALVTSGGASFVDGGVIGRPPHLPGDVRLYLSGERAEEVSALFEATVVSAPVIGAEPGAASAIKQAYAGWTKGGMALLIAVGQFAQVHGVWDPLRQEWAESIPGLEERHRAAEAAADGKGWRWIAEMEELVSAMDAAGVPSGFYEAAAKIFDRPRPGAA